MFFILIAYFCGIISAQEIPSLPRVKPYVVDLYNRITNVAGADDSRDESDNSRND
jgi:hypothetical protein